MFALEPIGGAQRSFPLLFQAFCDPTYRFALRVARPNNASPTTAPRFALGWVSSQVERLRENDHLPRSPSILSSPSTGVPIEGYDEMNVGEVVERLDNLSAKELKATLAYERQNKNRDTLVEQIDRRIKAAS